MDKNKANVPKIRFPGFTEPWEQRKLGEVLEIMTRTNNDSEYTRDDVLSVSDEYGVINQIKFQGRSFAAEDVTGYKKVVKGDIIYTRSPLAAKPFGIIKKVSNEEGIVSPLYIVNVPTEGNDSTFIYYNFDMPEKTNNYLRPLVRMGAKHTMNISNDEWLSGEIYVPSLAEQKKIGAYFAELDNRITLHQRKLNHLQDKKKGLLQKMFPKNGEAFPELRFPGFTEPWEQRKLKEVLDLLKDGTHGTHKDVDYGVYLLSAKNVKNGKIFIDETDRKISEEEYKAIHKNFSLKRGDVLLTIVGSIGETAILKNPVGITFQRSVAYLRPNDEITSEFLFTTIKTERFQRELKNRQVVSAQPGIYLGDLSVIPIQIPNEAEQKKIGEFFSNIDDLITLHQRKLNHLQEQKKALLQQMFI